MEVGTKPRLDENFNIEMIRSTTPQTLRVRRPTLYSIDSMIRLWLLSLTFREAYLSHSGKLIILSASLHRASGDQPFAVQFVVLRINQSELLSRFCERTGRAG